MTKKTKSLNEIFAELGFPKPEFESPGKLDAEMIAGIERNFRGAQVGPCGKNVFSSEGECKNAIRRKLRTGRANVSALIAYHCPTCRGWHMTSRDPIRRQFRKP